MDRYAYANNNPIRYTDPSGHSVECAVGEQYCEAGKLNVLKRSNDLYRSLQRYNPQLYWSGLKEEERDILSESNWDRGSYDDRSRVVPSDLVHDPLFWIEAVVILRGGIYALAGGTPVTVSILAKLGIVDKEI